MSDLRQRVPGHSLIEQLLREWDLGNIHPGSQPGEIVIDDRARGWYLGVHGERWVARRLATLGPEYTVLHSVPIGRGDSDIDHVVIGPAGVFTINSKYSPGKRVWSAGYGIYVGDFPEKHYIRNMQLEVRRAAARLSRASGLDIHPMGLIVFVDPASVTRKAPAGDGTLDIRVIADAELLPTIGNRPVFTPEEVARIADAASRPETWHDAPHESTIGSHIAQEFVALEEAVGVVGARAAATRRTARVPRRAVRPPTNWMTRDPVKRNPPARTRSHKFGSALRRLLTLAIVLGAWYWSTQPAGQAFLSGLFK
ncbi:MAG TPA: nuclease-related domain-containing protein [Pseudolysinimonas sp.]|jgi:hypothetical protein|nr:nuclease-related domain-containing protein [Pseudolysinimonas sp.]